MEALKSWATQNVIGDLFCNHYSRGVGITSDERGHDKGINYPEVLHFVYSSRFTAHRHGI